MSGNRELMKLATLLFHLTRHEVWEGGKNNDRLANEFLQRIQYPTRWSGRTYWTISPEVKLGGHRMRVGVATETRYIFVGTSGWKREEDRVFNVHRVVVWADGEVKYPGGESRLYYNFWPSWHSRIARNEIADGGRPGPVDTRELLIQEARGMVDAVPVSRQLPFTKTTEYMKAIDEVQRLLEDKNND